MTLIIGCGNLLRGDDAVGPALVGHLVQRGLPPGVRVVDCGTNGADVVLQLRGETRVILVDAVVSGAPPGTVRRMSGSELAAHPLPDALDVHRFRWDHALALAQTLLRDDYPDDVCVVLVEAGSFEAGAPLTPPVAAAVDALVDAVLAEATR